jgi:hypothetical protein
MAAMASSVLAGATQSGSFVGVSYSGLSGQGFGLEHPHPTRKRQLVTTVVSVNTRVNGVNI